MTQLLDLNPLGAWTALPTTQILIIIDHDRGKGGPVGIDHHEQEYEEGWYGCEPCQSLVRRVSDKRDELY